MLRKVWDQALLTHLLHARAQTLVKARAQQPRVVRDHRSDVLVFGVELVEVEVERQLEIVLDAASEDARPLGDHVERGFSRRVEGFLQPGNLLFVEGRAEGACSAVRYMHNSGTIDSAMKTRRCIYPTLLKDSRMEGNTMIVDYTTTFPSTINKLLAKNKIYNSSNNTSR